MRTTLDIDDGVMAAARAKAAADGTSLGRAVSELARAGLDGAARRQGRFPVLFPAVAGHVITTELVLEHAEDQ
ncbi:MAG: antitoxin [Bifidobacteriaceae bacterium]|jgi:hypothetical protein|nr:antitoxin [Bifidobacteriaceae bacterium]